MPGFLYAIPPNNLGRWLYASFHPPYNILNAAFLAFHAFPYLMVYPKKSFTSSFMSFSFMIGSFRILLMNLYAINEEVS
jgi:hypothetical protein